MDKLLVDAQGRATISNDGATILKLLEVVHPAARALVDVARAQDAQVGDGTTSVVLFAGELLRLARPFIEDGLAPQTIIKAYRAASAVAIRRVASLAREIEKINGQSEESLTDLLIKCAKTSMNSKLISAQQDFFAKMVVDAVMRLDQRELNERMIGIKRIPGGAMQDSLLVDGVAFKKTFAYAGFEQQPKCFHDPSIICLNLELELKAERDNAEVRIEQVSQYQEIVDAEWSIIYEKLERIVATGAKVVLSKLPIGDLATQYFADRDIFCAGRVPSEDLNRVVEAVGGSIQSSVVGIEPKHLGRCGVFEERQIGGVRYNFFSGCPNAKTCTLILRGGSEQLLAEVERSLHDAIMVVRRAIKTRSVVAGGGAIEMDLSKHLRDHALTIPGKQQLLLAAFAQAFEVIPRQLCENAGYDSTNIVTLLRQAHARGSRWDGVDMSGDIGGIRDNLAAHVWEPALIKTNMISAATELACMVLSVDLTVRPPPRNQELMQHALPGNH